MKAILMISRTLPFLLLAIFFVHCGGSSGGGQQAETQSETEVTDYSGTYYSTIASKPRSLLQIDQQGASVSFSLDSVYLFSGKGTVDGNTMALSAESGTEAVLNLSITFSEDGDGFSGTWKFAAGDVTISDGTISGTKSPWDTWDIEANGEPLFVTGDVLELQKIARISKLRSGAGHDYSDDFESCRSMKHYFIPKDGVDKLQVKVFSPVDGTVVALTNDWREDSVWKGEVVCIQSKDYPAFYFIVYHIVTSLDVGDNVVAGQLLGYPADYENTTIADTAVGVIGPDGYRLVSYFQVMNDTLFQNYQARGVSSRDEMVISKEERDADPLTCDGEEFVDEGHLENWVTLN